MRFKEIRQCIMCGNPNKKPVILSTKNSRLEPGKGEFVTKSAYKVRVTCSTKCSLKYKKLVDNHLLVSIPK